MNCPTCKASELRPVLTKQGVEVDYCDSCGGIWLDKGEIFHFTKRRKQLANALKNAVQQARGEALQELPLFDGTLVIDYCPASGGMWFDKGELKKVLTVDPKKLSIKIEPVMEEDSERGFDTDESIQPREPVSLTSLPNLGLPFLGPDNRGVYCCSPVPPGPVVDGPLIELVLQNGLGTSPSALTTSGEIYTWDLQRERYENP
jgi:Zn-finger nucleic acid-binding protein